MRCEADAGPGYGLTIQRTNYPEHLLKPLLPSARSQGAQGRITHIKARYEGNASWVTPTQIHNHLFDRGIHANRTILSPFSGAACPQCDLCSKHSHSLGSTLTEAYTRQSSESSPLLISGG